MNMKAGLKLAIAALCVLAMPASAATLKLDFNEFDDDVPASGGAAGAPAGPISFINTNHGVYDAYLPSILLGDDGWDSSIRFDARDGFIFDAISLRLVSGQQNVMTAPISGAVNTNSAFHQLQEAKRTGTLTKQVTPNVAFKGYRNGAVVAAQSETYDGGPPITKEFLGSFKNLTSLVVELDFGYADGTAPQIVGNTLYYCPNDRCGLLKFDDLLLDVQPIDAGPIAAVPLPAPILMLGTALFGMFTFTRRRTDHDTDTPS